VAVLGLAMCAIAVAGVACKTGRDKSGGPEPGVLGDGTTLGEIERLPGGTPVSQDVRTLLTLECVNNVVTLRTSAEQITFGMGCEQMLPEATIAGFIGQPVVIGVKDGRLSITNPTAGTMDFPADKPRVAATERAP